MPDKFRVRDATTNIVQTEGTWYVSSYGDILGEYDGCFDLLPHGKFKIEYHTGFNDKEGTPIYQHDTIEVVYNKQDADFLNKKTYLLTVEWDAYHGQWYTYQEQNGKMIPYAALYSVAKKCVVKKEN